MNPYHVSPHACHDGKLLVADGTAGLATMLLHVGCEVPTLQVLGATDMTAKRAICGRERPVRNGERDGIR